MSDTYKDHGHPPGWENEHDPRCQACAQSELAAMPGSVSEFQSEVSKWAYQTFPHQTPHSKMAHLRKEIDELAENTSDGEEMADCFILLLNLAEMAGVDLMTEARRKMEINRKRKWGAPDADGVCHHVKQNAPAMPTASEEHRKQ